jgi:hypothetical protein
MLAMKPAFLGLIACVIVLAVGVYFLARLGSSVPQSAVIQTDTLKASVYQTDPVIVTLKPPPAVCQERFVEYNPSTFEVQWGKHVASIDPPSTLVAHNFCADIVSSQFRQAFQLWIDIGRVHSAVRPANESGRFIQASELAAHPDIFSSIVFADSCTHTRREVFVAPLAGFLRDPRAVCIRAGDTAYAAAPLTPKVGGDAGSDGFQSKDMVIMDPVHAAERAAFISTQRSEGRPVKVFLFDAGASHFGDDGKGWPGMNWLVKRYRDLG